MAREDEQRKLYDRLSAHYNMPDYDDFVSSLGSEEGVRKAYTRAEKYYNMPTYEAFTSLLGVGGGGADGGADDASSSVSTDSASAGGVASSVGGDVGSASAAATRVPIYDWSTGEFTWSKDSGASVGGASEDVHSAENDIRMANVIGNARGVIDATRQQVDALGAAGGALRSGVGLTGGYTGYGSVGDRSNELLAEKLERESRALSQAAADRAAVSTAM